MNISQVKSFFFLPEHMQKFFSQNCIDCTIFRIDKTFYKTRKNWVLVRKKNAELKFGTRSFRKLLSSISKIHIRIHHGQEIGRSVGKSDLNTFFFSTLENLDYYFPIPRIHVDPRSCKYLCFSLSSIEDK